MLDIFSLERIEKRLIHAKEFELGFDVDDRKDLILLIKEYKELLKENWNLFDRYIALVENYDAPNKDK